MAKSLFKLEFILPKQLKLAQMQRELGTDMYAEVKEQGKEFYLTMRTWKRKAAFTQDMRATSAEMWAETSTDDFVYFILDTGPRKRSWIIRPRRARCLAFRGRYKAKTSPLWVGSRAGGSSGKTVFRPWVRHPGFNARRWAKTIAQYRIPPFRKRVQSTFDRWL